MTYNDLIQSFKQYRPEKQFSKKELEDAAEWLQLNPDKIPKHLIQSYRPEKDTTNGRLSDKRVKEIVSNVITSALPHIENFDYDQDKGNSGLPRKDNTEIGASGISLSEEGQARVLKESRAYKDAVTRYRKVVGGDVADEFLRTRPTLDQLKSATKGINGATLADITKKWGMAIGHKRR